VKDFWWSWRESTVTSTRASNDGDFLRNVLEGEQPGEQRNISGCLVNARGLPSTSMTRLDRITTNPAICHGKPTVRGLRYPVEVLLELLASGMTIEEVLEDYLDLERDDLLAALEFGAKTAGMRRVPLGAA